MEEKNIELLIREKLHELYIHVAAMPWKDEQFVRSEVAKIAAESQIVGHTVNEIMKLIEEKENA